MKYLFVLVEACDFQLSPVGGQLSFCKQILASFDEPILLVGVGSTNDPVGCWYQHRIGNREYTRFNLYRLSSEIKPKIPLRLKTLITLLFYWQAILAKTGDIPFFVNAPESVIALFSLRKKFTRFSYIFHGVENPLAMPRYKWGKAFLRPFEWMLKNALARAENILVCADGIGLQKVIDTYAVSSPDKVIQFPTRYNDSVFYSKPDIQSFDGIRLLCNGRINSVKGWEFILSAFQILLEKKNNFKFELVFVGDGEDRQALEASSKLNGLEQVVKVTGFLDAEVVCEYLNSADLVLVGSFKEGWSIAMLEALACGKNIISTNVSGAADLIDVGVNGFIEYDRDPTKYAELIYKAIEELPRINSRSIEIASKYKMNEFKSSLTSALKIDV
jgi:glycosyltransferase involved in cell wall biosynthesis